MECREMSSFMDWSAWRTRESLEDAEVMQWERVASMTWTNIEEESSVMPSLSLSGRRRSGCLERASGAMRSLPGTWSILRSKSSRFKSQ